MAADTGETGTETASTAPGSTVGLLRWAWGRYRRTPELLAPFALATVLVVAAQAGIETATTPYGTIPTFAPWVWPVYVLAVGSSLLGFGVAFLAAADAVAGSRRPFRARLRVAAERLPESLLAGVVGGIAVGGGLLTLLVPGLYLLSKLALAFPACVVDDLDAVTALRRSWLLTGGSALTVLALLALYLLVVVAVSVPVTVFLSSPEPGYAGPFVQNACTALVAPLFGLAFGRLYVVRRG